MTALLLTVGFVILVSAACSLAEAVLYSVPTSHIAKLQEEGRTSGALLAGLRERVDEPITAILTVNTVANTAGAAVAGALAAQALGENRLVLFSGALTVAILLFSEIFPKTLGVVYAREVSSLIARPLWVAVFVLKPVIALIGLVTRLISRSGGDDGVSQEEILTLTRLGHQTGALDASEAAVIENVLSLPEVSAREIMTPRTVVFALAAESTIEEACAEEGMMVYSRIPVYDGEVDDVVGVVFRRDLLAVETHEGHRTVREFIRPVVFVGEQEKLDAVLRMMLESKRHMSVVLDEFGGFAGVVTLEDVMETILGREILDEFDQVADLRALAVERRMQALHRMRGT